MEDNLELVGAIGVEDKLQDGVKDTLVALGQAGIKVKPSSSRVESEYKNFWQNLVIQKFLTKLGRHILSPFHMDMDKMWRPSFVKSFCIVILL